MNERKRVSYKKHYNITNYFVLKHLGQCPICKKESEWQISNSWRLMDREYIFRCSICDSVFKVLQSDITGESFTTNTLVGQMKKLNNKENGEIYLTIVKLGKDMSKYNNLIGIERTIQEIRNLFNFE